MSDSSTSEDPDPDDPETDRRLSRKASAMVLGWAGAISFVLCVVYFLVTRSIISNPQEQGLFGDMFGGLNALFSGLALVGAIYAVIMQREELELQRKEMRRNWKELEAQNQLIAEQLRTFKASSEQERLERQSRCAPILSWVNASNGVTIDYIFVSNRGGDITDVSIILEPGNESLNGVSLSKQDFWRKGEEATIELYWSGNSMEDYAFTLHYCDLLGERGVQRFVRQLGNTFPKQVKIEDSIRS